MPLRNLRAADGVQVREDDAVFTSVENDLVPPGLVDEASAKRTVVAFLSSALMKD